ncbi:MAG: DUF1269 domain-containing protein [Chloroflexota bacterium]
MSNLVVITYDTEGKAAEVLETVRRLESERLIDLEDAVYVTKDTSGKAHLHQSFDLAKAGAVSGGLWGALFGLLFLVPIAGLAIGAGIGAMAGRAQDYGIDDKFIKDLGKKMKPGSSAIFALVRQSTPERVLPEIAKYGGEVVHTSLSPDAEERLKRAVEEAKGSSPQSGGGLSTGNQPW